MKTLTEFKRTLKAGAKVAYIFRGDESTKTESTIAEVLTSGYYRNVEKNGKVCQSYGAWPKASECRIEGNRLIVLCPDYAKYKEETPEREQTWNMEEVSAICWRKGWTTENFSLEIIR